jgi:hypothetical protein
VFASPITKARVVDAFTHGTNSPQSATISGLTQLEDRQVKVWADGAPITEVVNGRTVPKLFTVSGGSINVGNPVAEWVVGLPYEGTYKSSRLAYAAAGGTAILQNKRVNAFGLVFTNYVRSGILYGRSFDELHPLPQQSQYKDAAEVVLGDVDDSEMLPFDGKYGKDPRICLEVHWPAQFLGNVFTVTTNG